MINLVYILVGLAALLFGRRLFWLFVAVIGFLFGLQIAPQVLPSPQDATTVLIISVAFGIIGALLAVWLPRALASIAGFLAGGAIALLIVGQLNLNLGGAQILAFIVGGIVGVILIMLVFDLALVLLSAVVGADLAVQGLSQLTTITAQTTTIVLVLLVIVGVIVQLGLLRSHPHNRSRALP